MQTDKLIWVLSSGNGNDADVHPRVPQQVNGPLGSLLSGGIGVKHQRHRGGVPGDKTGVLRGKGSAQRRHSIGEPRLMQGDNIHIAFAQDQSVPSPTLGKVKGEQVVGLFKRQGIAAVQILWLGIV